MSVRPEWHFRLALVVVLCAVFYPVLLADFLSWDDRTHLHENPWFWPPSQRSLSRFWVEPYWGLYVPVAYNFWGLVAGVATATSPDGTPELVAGPFHAANLGLHCLASLLVYSVLRNLGHRQAVAWLSAALFALHPLQVESVAWVSEGRGLLAAVLAFSALLQFWRAFEPSSASRGSSVSASSFWIRYLAATALYVGAILAKPSAVALPLMALVIVIAQKPSEWERRARWLVPWFVIAFGDAGLMKILQPAESVAATISLVQRLGVSLDALAFYVGKFALPWPLAIDYGRRPEVALTSATLSMAVLVLGGVVIAGFFVRPRRDWWTGWAMFAAGVAPVLGIIPFEFQAISTVADRYVYLAMFGPAWILAALLSRLPSIQPTVRYGLIGWLGALAIVSATQVRYWHDDDTLFRHTLTINPQSVVALANLGYVHQQRHDFAQATRFYLATIAVAPHEEVALKGLGEIAMESGDLATAVARFRQATEAKPQDAAAWNNWGIALGAQGKFPEAEARLRRAIELAPRPYAEFHENLARALIEQQRLSEARAELDRARMIAPDSLGVRELLHALGR